MCVKFSPRDLNLDPSSLHPTNTYTCGVIITLRVCDGMTYVLRPSLLFLSF